jgi:hypothetical protein
LKSQLFEEIDKGEEREKNIMASEEDAIYFSLSSWR